MSSLPIPDPTPSQALGTPWESFAAAQLQRRLEESAELMAQCLKVATAEEADRVAGLSAAARIMRANAQVAEMLQRLVRGETRHRTIVEQIPWLPPKQPLNSEKEDEGDIAEMLEERFRQFHDALTAEDLEEQVHELQLEIEQKRAQGRTRRPA